MATRQEIVGKLAARRVQGHYLPNLSRQQIRTAAQALTNAEWDDIISGIKEREFNEVGEVLAKRVREFLMDLATTDVTNSIDQDGKIAVDDIIALLR